MRRDLKREKKKEREKERESESEVGCGPWLLVHRLNSPASIIKYQMEEGV